ncbi:ABC transporter permease [Parablautia muri]|uniref:ABC transporter permease n=1 Tax=Parablautia muri TaxID=2320879 RepID=A0A9X5GT22_9FIRM|nr:ABC transporter permease subunit [Parablautia muri]NBJ93759.1 ABC transporter permease [Parablautia muri]
MRLFKLEIKRILKTRATLVLLFLALGLSFVMAYLPITFSYNSYTDANGDTVKLTGLASIAYEKKLQADIAGSVTPQKVRQAVESYQACLTKYGVENSYDLPEGVYQSEIFPYAPLLHGIREAFADRSTGIAPSIMEIAPQEVDRYYEVCRERLVSLMQMEQEKHPAAQKAAVTMYEKVEKPYLFFPGYSTDAMDYQIILAFLVLLFCAIIAAPVFTSDYQTGADDILRCTKCGKIKFAVTKMISMLFITGITFTLCAVIYITVSNNLWGWECTKTSIQMLYSIVNLPNMNIGQLQCFIAIFGLVCILSNVSFTLFLSSRFKNLTASLSAALLFCILPTIIYMLLPAEIGSWIYSILPAGGNGLQTSVLYAAIDFDFWNIGTISIWLPHVMLGAYIIEIPLFLFLTVYSYVKHEAG